MQSRSHSLSDHSAFHLALIAFVCVVMVLLSGSSSTRLASTTRQIDDRVERIEASNHTAVPMVSLDTRTSEDLHDQVGEFPERSDDDETERCLLRLIVALRLDVPAFGSQADLYESSADRALTPFRLRAFSSRGTPSA